MKIDTRTLAGTIVLAALVVVFDYAMRYSGLKIPFPWFPTLKFDFTGIPIVLSLLLYGLVPGAFTSAIAVLAILARSGNIVSSFMKGLAEFSTVLGMFLGLKIAKRFKLPAAYFLGISTRVIVMTIANLALIYMGFLRYGDALLIFVLLTGVFNAIQGTISIVCGYLIYAAVKRRVPALTEEVTTKNENS
jgi:riboflavin transporter FmnP